jgi:predicted RNA polymerase sigma factor
MVSVSAEIARALFVPEAIMSQRISRAKQGIREADATISMPPPAELEDHLRGAARPLPDLQRGPHRQLRRDGHQHRPTHEAIRLTRQLHLARPDDVEVKGLLALMLLTEARRPARVDPVGRLVDLPSQDRRRWDRSLIEEGVRLVTEALQQGPPGAYQLQAAIAAIHDEASSPQDTDWAEILLL